MRKKNKSTSLSEAQVLQELGISDFRHMSKDKIMQFCSMVPDMDPEVARLAFEQFPNFAKLSSETMICFKEMVNSSLKENNANMKDFNASCDTIIESLQSLMKQKRIKKEERALIIDNMLKVLQMKADKDRDNKEWLSKVIATAGAVAVAIIGVAGAIVGVNLSNKKSK